MTRLLIILFRSSRPVLTASSWLSMFAIATMVAVLPPMTLLAGSAYGFGGDEETAQSQSGGSIRAPSDNILKLIRGEGGQATESRREDRAGKRVTLQAGHWRYWESPSPFNTQTGTSGGGKTEPEVTLDIAQRAEKILEDMGYTVEILPAWFTQGYTADAVVAIHADGADNPEARGFFAERYGDSAVPNVDDRFMTTLDDEYAKATGLPFKYRSTSDSRYYYGFSRIQPKTPMILIETGFLTNEQDREIIVNDSDRAAQGIANGIDKFLVP